MYPLFGLNRTLFTNIFSEALKGQPSTLPIPYTLNPKPYTLNEAGICLRFACGEQKEVTAP